MAISGIQGVATGWNAVATSALQAAYYDPKDANQDGIVTPAEALAYSQKHPMADAIKRLREELISPARGSRPEDQPYTWNGERFGQAGNRSQWLDTYV
ncbi:MAG: hypothetical protein H6P99_1067 [Holophagaceae bacterium]|nr:hypothetical protein [Holophagaceae bacterium]